MKKKVESLKYQIKHLNIGVFTLQETQFSKRGKLQIDGFEIFEALRKKEGGGTLIGAHKSLEPILIHEYSEEFELLVVEINIGGKYIRIVSGYGPQETWAIEKRMPFFAALEEELTKSELAGTSVLVCFDANSKMGPSFIPGDPHTQSENGKIMEGIIERHALTVANGIKDWSKGVITRSRTTVNGVEESVIDLVLISQDLVESLDTIVIDEEKLNALESLTKSKKSISVKKSDHNSIISKFKVKWDKEVKRCRVEHFNLKDINGLAKFKDMTSFDTLSKVVEKEKDFNTLTKNFI